MQAHALSLLSSRRKRRNCDAIAPFGERSQFRRGFCRSIRFPPGVPSTHGMQTHALPNLLFSSCCDSRSSQLYYSRSFCPFIRLCEWSLNAKGLAGDPQALFAAVFPVFVLSVYTDAGPTGLSPSLLNKKLLVIRSSGAAIR